MFTGIIEDLGSIASIKQSPDGAVVTIRTKLPLAKITIGESIAVNGCCLTVTRKGQGTFTMDVSPESLRRTVLGKLKPGDRVNLERCLTLEKLLGGHMVSGHVDGVGKIVSIEPEGDSRLYTFEVSGREAHYLIEKGSVGIDGISLTVFDIRRKKDSATFKVALIPHTLKVTTLGFKRPNDAVNIESDLLVKYVERVASPYLGNGKVKKAGEKAKIVRKLASGGLSR
ncbi:MAG TPA: riboflavin synthase [Candidatus Binataceae bacterium]|nr:riboflavin synthase [Candidatus Binataceae bacterium]